MQVDKIIKNIDSGRLKLSDFNNDEILEKLDEKDLIGQGAVGKVYLQGKTVIKEILPCSSDSGSALYQYCVDLNNLKEETDKNIQVTPGGNSKRRYSLPNLLTEISNGMILGRMKESVGFTPTLNSNITKDLNVYIKMQANKNVVDYGNLNPLLKMTGDNPKTFIYMLFQISHALLTAQEKYKMTHYDLHIENILWTDWPEDKKYLSYPLPNTDDRLIIFKNYCPYILKISDFALSRLETKNSLVTPLIDTFPVKTYGEFHPSYDIISLIGTILIDNKYRVAFDSLFDNLDIYKFMIMFSLWVLNDEEIKVESGLDRAELDEIRDLIGNKYFTNIGTVENKFNFRPKMEGDFVTYSNAKSLVKIVNFLGKILQAKKYALTSNTMNEKVIYLKRLDKYKEYNYVSEYTPDITVKNFPKKGKTLGNYEEMKIDNELKVRSYHVLTNLPPKDFNFTIEGKQLETCPIQEHYMTVLFVNRDYLKTHKFKLDCCKLDPANYMLKNNKVGFVINGGFFDIKGDYLPIGPYKNEYTDVYNHEIPEKYKDVFRYVVLKDNKISIKKKYNKAAQLFSTGPILIENGKIVLNLEEERFNCTDVKHSKSDVLNVYEETITVSGHYKYKSEDLSCSKEFVSSVKTYPRCDRIMPGELSHAGNPNPRSVLCILEDGSYMFITVEGRSRRGVGFDLYTMARSIILSFPKVKTMVNLDGGRSSNIAWRTESGTESENKVYISNPDHVYPYPVGNILTLFKNI